MQNPRQQMLYVLRKPACLCTCIVCVRVPTCKLVSVCLYLSMQCACVLYVEMLGQFCKVIVASQAALLKYAADVNSCGRMLRSSVSC